jgi:hypothetical protein
MFLFKEIHFHNVKTIKANHSIRFFIGCARVIAYCEWMTGNSGTWAKFCNDK